VANSTTLGGKSVARIRRDHIDRIFIGTHSAQIQGRETWYEMTHMLKGATFQARHVIEQNGDGGQQPGAGFMIDIAAEPIQNNYTDYQFYDQILNGKRNVIIVTGKGDRKLLRAFRLLYLGGGKWADNRIYLVTDDSYNSSIDKASMKSTGWVQTFERYTIGAVALANNKLTFNILEGTTPSVPTGTPTSTIG
jgi:hypothetical protein